MSHHLITSLVKQAWNKELLLSLSKHSSHSFIIISFENFLDESQKCLLLSLCSVVRVVYDWAGSTQEPSLFHFFLQVRWTYQKISYWCSEVLISYHDVHQLEDFIWESSHYVTIEIANALIPHFQFVLFLSKMRTLTQFDRKLHNTPWLDP